MKRLFLLAFALFCLVEPAGADVVRGKVVSVVDGNTLTVRDYDNESHTVRLAGVEAPKLAQRQGAQSRRHLADLVSGKTVDVEWHRSDEQSRLVGKVILEGEDINLSLLRDGWASHGKANESELPEQDREQYALAEDDARSRRVGLWQASKPQPTQVAQAARPAPPKAAKAAGAPKPAVRRKAGGKGCPCSGEISCTGPRGGHYCITTGGKKRYR